jgi:hypothetical protein
MMDSTHKHMDRLGAKACKSQGGAYRNQGAKSTGGQGPSTYGDEYSVSSEHMTHDKKMHEQGGSGRMIKSIGSCSCKNQ